MSEAEETVSFLSLALLLSQRSQDLPGRLKSATMTTYGSVRVWVVIAGVALIQKVEARDSKRPKNDRPGTPAGTSDEDSNGS